MRLTRISQCPCFARLLCRFQVSCHQDFIKGRYEEFLAVACPITQLPSPGNTTCRKTGLIEIRIDTAERGMGDSKLRVDFRRTPEERQRRRGAMHGMNLPS